MSTRYIWGQYTINQMTYPYNYYVAQYDTGSGDYRTAGESGDKVYLYERYSLNSNTGSFTGSGGWIITLGSGMAGKNYGAGYYPATYGDTGYNAKYALIYSSSWIGRDYWNAEGFCVEAASWRGYYAQLISGTEFEETQGSLMGYVSSDNSSTYPRNGKYNGSWYVYQGTDNIDPKSVSIPETINGGSMIMITITPSSSQSTGPTVSYVIQYKFGSGSWQTLATVTNTQYSLSVPMDTETVQVRVQAKDASNFISSTYVMSEVVEVINGKPPTITSELGDSPADLGQVTEAFYFDYTLTDPDYGDTSTVTEVLNAGEASTTRTRQKVASYTTIECELAKDDAVFQKIPNEEQCSITLSAIDSHKQVSNTYIVYFEKYADEVTITLKNPMEISGDITEGVIYMIGYIPEDATFTVMVTNNANDEEPRWQDVTEEVRQNKVFNLVNTKAEAGSAFNFTMYAKRGESKQTGYIDEIIGAFM